MENITKSNRKRRGQTLILLLMALVILLFVILLSTDIHRAIFVKDKSQNAGDAAALAAARWQASSLNLVGELNLFHAIALASGNADAVDVITNTQARMLFAGPMVGMAAAQQAAKLNMIHNNDEFTGLVKERADIVRLQYNRSFNGNKTFPEPYDNAWSEYADMLDAIGDDGVAAGADNAVFFTDFAGAHTLLNPAFYDAIAGRTWCWFYMHEPGLLEGYAGYGWWPPLPEEDDRTYDNCEIFPLQAQHVTAVVTYIIPSNDLIRAARELDHELPRHQDEALWESAENWYVYPYGKWGAWDAMDAPFPVRGRVKQEYDYQGADAATRVQAKSTRITPGAAKKDDTIIWTAAAKPFGYLIDSESGGVRIRPNSHRMVLPAFRSVNLVPIDASSAGNGGGSFNLAWRRHVERHLEHYMSHGPNRYADECFYCALLKIWEERSFRQRGIDWLEEHHDLCTLPSHSGGGPGGGTRRPH